MAVFFPYHGQYDKFENEDLDSKTESEPKKIDSEKLSPLDKEILIEAETLNLYGNKKSQEGALGYMEIIKKSDQDFLDKIYKKYKKGEISKEQMEDISQSILVSDNNPLFPTIKGVIGNNKVWIYRSGGNEESYDYNGEINGKEGQREDLGEIYKRFEQIAKDRTARLLYISACDNEMAFGPRKEETAFNERRKTQKEGQEKFFSDKKQQETIDNRAIEEIRSKLAVNNLSVEELIVQDMTDNNFMLEGNKMEKKIPRMGIMEKIRNLFKK